MEPILDELFRHAVLWQYGTEPVEPLVRTACEALVAGLDSPALRDLAGLSVRADDHPAVEVVVAAALAEHGRTLPRRDSDELTVAVLRLRCAEAVAGELPLRELARWAHQVIGHQGIRLAQPFVDADDEYDVAAYDGRDVTEIDATVRAAATDLAPPVPDPPRA